MKTKNKVNMGENEVKVFENEQVEQNRVDCNDIGLKDMYIYHKLTFFAVKQRKADGFFDATDLLEQCNHIIEQAINSNLPRFRGNYNSHNKIDAFFEWKGYKKTIENYCAIFGVYDDSYFVKTTKEGNDVKVWLHGVMIEIYLRWLHILTEMHFVAYEDLAIGWNALCEQRKICNKGREIY